MDPNKKYIPVDDLGKPQKQSEFNYIPNSSKEAQREELKELYKEFDASTEEYKRKVLNQDKKQKLVERNAQYSLKIDKKDDLPIDGDYVLGSKVFMEHCSNCHSLNQNNQKKQTTGPALGSIFGKMAASDIYYKNYSYPLIKSKIFWTSNNLNDFIQGPQNMINQNKCKIKNNGIQDEEKRTDLITFLKFYGKRLKENIRYQQIKNFGKEYYDTQQLTESEMSKLK